MISIQEFSTGIQYETTPTGWRSRGFTGYFINKTIDPIPSAIQTAINDRQFALAEGTIKEKVALIGREVGQSGDQWSVLAVITRAEDEFGRSFPVYRFFYTQEKGNLEYLLGWWIDNQQPTFDPLDKPEVKWYQIGENIEISLNDFQQILQEKVPIVLPPEKNYPPLVIHALAQKTAGIDNVAWAWNVGGIEYPNSFHIIYPDEPKASEMIHRVIQTQPDSTGVFTGENIIKLAIENLSNDDEINGNDVETLETALEQSKFTTQQWLSFFEDKGARQAIDQKIHTDNMVCLLTLQAIIVPSTIAQFLRWLKQSPKQLENQEISTDFQQQMFTNITKRAPVMSQNVSDGVKLSIVNLLDEPDLLEMTTWLLKDYSGIWPNAYRNEVDKLIGEDLSLMSDYARNKIGLNKISEDTQGFYLLPYWEKIWSEIKQYWLINEYKPLAKYLPIAQLIERLGNYKVSAVFYQIAIGSVHRKLYERVAEASPTFAIYRGFRIRKQNAGLEILGLPLPSLRDKFVPAIVMIPLLLASFVLGGFTEYLAKIGISSTTNPSPSKIKEVDKPTNNNTTVLPTPMPLIPSKKP